jgi:hypothetical protein
MLRNLDEEIRRIALLEARKFVAQGLAIEQAVAQACKGNWAYQCDGVKTELHKTMKEAFGNKDNHGLDQRPPLMPALPGNRGRHGKNFFIKAWFLTRRMLHLRLFVPNDQSDARAT